MKTKLTRHNGVLKIDIDGKLYDPLSFKSFRPNPKNVSEFYQAGVRLFSVLSSGIICALGVPYSLYGESWVGENEYDFSAIDRQIDMFIENAPEGYFAPMFQIDTREWYLALHPEVPNSFTHLSQIACDETWKKQAADYLKAAITHCEEKYGDRIYGYFLLGGTTTEWFSDGDYETSHPIKEQGFKAWTKDFNATLPPLDKLNADGDNFLGEEEKDVYTARKFHAEIIADLILYFADQAQSILKHEKLVGIYYGYLFELASQRLYNAGSLAYEKVFKSPDINMISSPSAYCFREIDGSSAFMLTQKTLDAHDKLYFLEFDHRTHIAPDRIEDPVGADSKNKIMTMIPGGATVLKNETQSLNVMYRDFLLCNANRCAMWWFDMFDGWFRSEGMMQAISHMLSLEKQLASFPTKRISDIAVFCEGESMYRVRKSAKIVTDCLHEIRITTAECGIAYDLYSIMDEELPETENYKIYLFANQYDLPEARKTRIFNRFAKQGKTLVWFYAPNYATNGENDVSRISNLTGISVKESKTPHGALIVDGKKYEYGSNAPYFSICDEKATPLACFEDGSVACAYKQTNGVKQVYAATCNIPSALLREIGRLAGAFVYSDNPRVYVYPNSATLGVYNASGENAVIRVNEEGMYEDMIKNIRYKSENGELILPLRDINAFLLRKVEE